MLDRLRLANRLSLRDPGPVAGGPRTGRRLGATPVPLKDTETVR
ncbi:hypothetical protein [Streptomyces sp. NPDC050548]